MLTKLFRGIKSLIVRLFLFIMGLLFKLSMLITFLGIIPTVLFIYYNMYYFNAVRVIIGCITVLVITHINKQIQGGS